MRPLGGGALLKEVHPWGGLCELIASLCSIRVAEDVISRLSGLAVCSHAASTTAGLPVSQHNSFFSLSLLWVTVFYPSCRKVTNTAFSFLIQETSLIIYMCSSMWDAYIFM